VATAFPGIWIALLGLSLAAGPALGQDAPTIEKVRIGFSSGRGDAQDGLSRAGSWMPVAVTVRAGKQGVKPPLEGGKLQEGCYRVRALGLDGEELKSAYTVDVPALAAGEEAVVHAYLAPGPDNAPVTVRLESWDGQVVSRRENIPRELESLIDGQEALFLALGPGLAQLKKAGEKGEAPENAEGKAPEQARRRFAALEEVSALPDRWLGYAGADVLILSMNKNELASRLAREPRKCQAIRDWVSRGGKLVVSIGEGWQQAAELLSGPKAPLGMTPLEVGKPEVVRSLPALSTLFCQQAARKSVLQGLEVAEVRPGPGMAVLVRDGGKPVLLQGSYGMGRVFVLAFDLGSPRFTGWDGQEAFWSRIQQELAPGLAAPRPARGGPGGGVALEGRGTSLKQDLLTAQESFEEAPPIPFAAVALFILFYILLVGPIDYLLLRRVFRKLEYTWVTFPLMVLAASALAYFTALALKGEDLRVNKADLVDLDLSEPGGRAHGNTWVTVFSPAARALTLAVEPAAGPWREAQMDKAPAVYHWLFSSNEAYRGAGQGLFPNPYEYSPAASGLIKVPVAVWATRSVEASWQAPLGTSSPLGIRDGLGIPRQSPDGKGLSGKLTNHLEAPLLGCALFYRERWFDLGDLAPGESRQLDPLFARNAQGQSVATWFSPDVLKPGLPLTEGGRRISSVFLQGRKTYEALKRALFHQMDEGAPASNAGLAHLNQSWRLRPLTQLPPPERPAWREEAILVARLPMITGGLDWVNSHPASPTRLWLGKLPASGEPLPSHAGQVTQETFVRAFIPVQASGR
jgi:hypothetical protein